MSSLYNLEPQPTASCILHTTSGDISLELWAQQIPLATRNFLQNSLDGYYNNTIFHRLVPGFILQGGDPTGTGAGGESIYDGGAFSEAREEGGIWPMEDRKGRNFGKQGVGFKDEYHSRIKFNRRGLLGMANEGPDSNGSQFFITLGETPELQGKNTCFGRVQGDTIYNVARMGEMEVGEGERPFYPVTVTDVEVLVNPFKDMIIRGRTAPISEKEKVLEKKKRKKGGKQLLSFGDDEADDIQPLSKKAKFDTRIVAGDGEPAHASDLHTSSKQPQKRREARSRSKSSTPDNTRSQEQSTSSAPRIRPTSNSPSRSPSPTQQESSLLARTNAQIAALKASMKRNVPTPAPSSKPVTLLEQMIPKTSVRGRKRRPGGNSTIESDKLALNMLASFRAKLEKAPSEQGFSKDMPPPEEQKKSGAVDAKGERREEEDEGEGEEAILCDLHFIASCASCKAWVTTHDDQVREAEAGSQNDESWMSHALSFERDRLGKDLTFRKKAEEELVVIDPREKARSLKEEKRAGREARGPGNGRQWDQMRNEKLARASAIAGRGAK